MLCKWEKLPRQLRKTAIKSYYDILASKRASLFVKRLLDLIFAIVLLILISPVLLIVAGIIKLSDYGPVFFRQVRITQYGREFRIFKFRTMVVNAEQLGNQVTSEADPRVTKIGRVLRKLRLDELPQLLNVIAGDMSFVGTRPEVPKFVKAYTDEMLATLLLPAGVTSMASIKFKDEDRILGKSKDTDDTYINKVLPQKMEYNLEELKEFSIRRDIYTIITTVKEVFF